MQLQAAGCEKIVVSGSDFHPCPPSHALPAHVQRELVAHFSQLRTEVDERRDRLSDDQRIRMRHKFPALSQYARSMRTKAQPRTRSRQQLVPALLSEIKNGARLRKSGPGAGNSMTLGRVSSNSKSVTASPAAQSIGNRSLTGNTVISSPICAKPSISIKPTYKLSRSGEYILLYSILCRIKNWI